VPLIAENVTVVAAPDVVTTQSAHTLQPSQPPVTNHRVTDGAHALIPYRAAVECCFQLDPYLGYIFTLVTASVSVHKPLDRTA
jgi:hypothetical protein